MSKHLFGQILTGYGTAANNRGENEGNITTLQKILWKGNVHTTVSAEAIRWAVRYYWQLSGDNVNRTWNPKTSDTEWKDPRWAGWTEKKKGGTTYIDDDILGFMMAEAGKQDGEKGQAIKRKGMLEVTRAISLDPYNGDITFNAKSGEKTRTSLYGTEVHATRYQYGLSFTPDLLYDKNRATRVVEAILNLSQVAGNQSRFLYDFSPESIILRWTDDFAPRILYGFQADHHGEISVPEVIRKVQAGDIDPASLVIGGFITNNEAVQGLQKMGVVIFPGIKQACEEIQSRMRMDLK